MVLGITINNEKLIREICAKYDYDDIEVYTGIRNLKDYAVRELQNLTSFKYLILDISDYKDKEEIVKAVVAIKSLHNIRIIILAIGYKEGDSLLSNLFKEGIYNFVIGDNYQKQVEEFEKCLSETGNEYKDAVRFRVEDKALKGKNKVIIKKEYKKLKQLLTVGVAGTQSHIGTTTQALLLCGFFNIRGLKACYISANNSKDIEELKNLAEVEIKNNMFTYCNIDIYDNNERISAMEYGYDIYIYDYGVLNNDNFNSFINNDKKIIVAGSKYWELHNNFKTLNKMKQLPETYFIISHCPAEDENGIVSNFPKHKKKVFFSEYSPNPFDFKNADIFLNVFKDNIEEKSSNLVPTERKSIFDFLKLKFKWEKIYIKNFKRN